MDAGRQGRAKAVFLEAIDRAEEEWPAYLDATVGDEPEVRAEVERLLSEHARLGEIKTGPFEGPGTVFGRYRLVEEIGRGGFATVYVAEQTEPVRRRVALKILTPGMDTRAVVARFEAERQALALMDHPHIAKIFDAGSTPSGRPYFVMELVDGRPITEYCDATRRTLQERLELFRKVCLAIEHAHARGVVHRDIKPWNVLVSETDGEPAPKVIDFGIAKALGGELGDATLTQLHAILGTPASMAPEQTDPGGVGIDGRTDVYALGALLYQLLAGVAPLDMDGLAVPDMLLAIRQKEPVRPSHRIRAAKQTANAPVSRPEVSGDLDWITLRCLEKEPERRYQRAAELAEDVARHLRHEPVSASPPGWWYRTRKLARRHRDGLLMTGLLLAAVVVTAAVALQRGQAEAADRAQLAELVSDVLAGLEPDLDERAETQALLERWSRRVVAGEASATDLEMLVRLITRFTIEARSMIPFTGEPTRARVVMRARDAVWLPGISLAYRTRARVNTDPPFGLEGAVELYGKDGGGGTHFMYLGITPTEGDNVLTVTVDVTLVAAAADAPYMKRRHIGWSADREVLGECSIELEPLPFTAARGIEVQIREIDDATLAAETDKRVNARELRLLAPGATPRSDDALWSLWLEFEEQVAPLALEVELRDTGGRLVASGDLIVSRRGEVLGQVQFDGLPREDGRWIPMSCRVYLAPLVDPEPVVGPLTLTLRSSARVAQALPALDAFLRFETTRELEVLR